MLNALTTKKKTTKTKKTLKDPKNAHFEFKDKDGKLDKTKERKYFDIDDVPEAFLGEPDELTGKKDVELIRVIGFLYKAVLELNDEVEDLKKGKKPK
jgi:hypothetical protein